MYRRSKVKWREEGDGILIFCPSRSHMFRLNATGRIIWYEIENNSTEDIARKIALEYDVSEELALLDVRACINDMLSREILSEAHNG